MQILLIDNSVLVNTLGAFKNINCADQYECFALDSCQVGDQLVNFLLICLGITIGNPFLRRGTSTDDRIKCQAVDFTDVG
ncbi:hypothetical protein D3C78_1775870 [compost metagenome]